ncbi:MAG TPA: hypothetical protein VKM72_33755 [Thermoanaerobaculia bacterium]|nr:hypothetical protein [Thermoanaerobaculia bacterium]
MSTQAQALVAEVESIEELVTHKTVIEAKILVTALGSEELSFSSFSPAISINGRDITLKPSSSTEQPVLYNLKFEAGSGVELFLTPAATFGEKQGALAVNPADLGREFHLCFVNDLGPLAKVSYDFDIHWAEPDTGLQSSFVRRVATDPTIILEAPNS